MEKFADPQLRLWYAAQATENGWSRDVLAHHITTRLHERTGTAVTNFAATLPPGDSALAQQATRDPYPFWFAPEFAIQIDLVISLSGSVPFGVHRPRGSTWQASPPAAGFTRRICPTGRDVIEELAGRSAASSGPTGGAGPAPYPFWGFTRTHRMQGDESSAR